MSAWRKRGGASAAKAPALLPNLYSPYELWALDPYAAGGAGIGRVNARHLVVGNGAGYGPVNRPGQHAGLAGGAFPTGAATEASVALDAPQTNGPWTFACVMTVAGARLGEIDQLIVGQDSGGGLASRLYLAASNMELHYFSDTGPVDIASGLTLTKGVFHFVAMTVSAAGAVKFYVDGASSSPGGAAVITGRTGPFRFCLTGLNGNQFHGSIANTGLWLSELTAPQVASLRAEAMGV